jgi:hypothetical protein
MACEIKDLKLIKLAFESISDAELSKVALTTLHSVVTKSLGQNSKELKKQVEAGFFEFKSELLTKVRPSSENRNDPYVIIKAIQIASNFASQLAAESVSMIVNNMHNGSQAVREEAARFMI